MAQYSYATVASVVTALAARLYDPTKQQWTDAELNTLVVDSLRTWNALSQFWRSEFSFNLDSNVWWYDLRSANNSLIPYSVNEDQILTRIQRHLLEPPTGSTWTGSNQFTIADLNGACWRRQDEILGQTACTISRLTPAANQTRRTTLVDSVIDIRRVAWLPSNNNYTNKVMRQSDVWAARAFQAGYQSANNSPPMTWFQNTEPVPSFDVDNIPPVAGNYEVMAVQSGPAWAGGNNAITIPTDWTWVLQFGAMADLFSRESSAADPLRAAYCRARYEEGIALLRMMPVGLAMNINGVPMSIGSVQGADQFNPGWQGQNANAPTQVYEFMNYLAVAPKPNNNNFTATVSVCQNAPVSDSDIQVARDDLDTVIDYAQHLAMLKMGGEEFYKSIALYQNMQKKAASYNGKLREMGFFEMPQLDLATQDERRNPRFIKGTEPVLG